MKSEEDRAAVACRGERVGVLIANHGSPRSPAARDVRRYLRAFLSDPRVVEAPRWFWLPILNAVILTTRPQKTAQMYRAIWTEAGAPLAVLMDRLAAALEHGIRRGDRDVRVVVGSTYGAPSLSEALAQLAAENVSRIIVLPLYPQYSGSTTAAVFDQVTRIVERWPSFPALRFVNDYSGHPQYIEALARSVRAHWQVHGRGERLLMSYHGIPREYFEAGDPYYCYCARTTRLLAAELGLGEADYGMSFQSRFGPKEWLQPYTDRLLAEWREAGVERVDIMCPGFAVDCLETLEEIEGEVTEGFAELGGQLRYIACLNDSEGHVEALASLVSLNAGDWLAPAAEPTPPAHMAVAG